nr:MAG TPA: hypothetical protein [Crassvirales sp.]
MNKLLFYIPNFILNVILLKMLNILLKLLLIM